MPIRLLAFLPIVALLVSTASAQPRVTNGELRIMPPASALERTVLDLARMQQTPAWIGYGVPMAPGDHQMCWTRDRTTTLSGGPTVMRLEGPRLLWVLFRVDAGVIREIRAVSEECALDLGGLTLHWFPNGSAGESLDVLNGLMTDRDERVLRGVVTAITFHDDARALDTLILTARDNPAPEVRGEALFWLAQKAGARAVSSIAEAVVRDPDTAVKKRAVFALSQLPPDQAVPRLIDVARTNRNPEVRRQAMFWLGQSGDDRALRFFEEVLK